MKPAKALIGAAILATLANAPALAQDALKIAIGQINNWENQPPTLGQDAGIFAKHNLKVEAVGTQGAGETIQAVISGSADLGAGVGVAGAMRAFAKGAPVRILLPAFTGTGDLYWYVKADSPIKSLKDTTDKNTIAYSTNGSSSHNIVASFTQELGAKAKPTATGGPPGTLTSVMSGQVDIGWAAPPFGMKELKAGQIRIIARGSDVPSLRNQTVRSIIVNAAGCHDGDLFCQSLYLGKKIPLAGVAHQCGTVRFGRDPQTSALNSDCRAHDVDNLYVVDGSFFVSSTAVNPALTIMANALRVGDHILSRLGNGRSVQ